MSEKSHTAANSTVTLPSLSPRHCKFTLHIYYDAHDKKPLNFNQCDYTYAQAHWLQKYKMTHTGEKAHIPSLPYTRTKRSMPRSIRLSTVTLFDETPV